MYQSAFGTRPRITLILALALFALWLTIYAFTVSPSVNFIDSGELITTLHEPGVAHPPGYPLYTLMGYVVTHLLGGEIAWRVNILSAFWGAMALGTFFLFLVATANYLSQKGNQNGRKGSDPYWRGKQSTRKESPRAQRAKAAVTVKEQKEQVETSEPVIWGFQVRELLTLGTAVSVASLLGASSTFWSRTAQAKMYTLHYFFIALVYLCALFARWAYERKDDKATRRWLLALNIGLGLSLANHLMTVLLVPGLLLMLLAGSDPAPRLRALLSRWMYGIPAVVIPILLYLYLPLRASQHPLMNWGSTDNLGDFWRHITGWQYGAYVTGTKFSVLWEFIVQQWSWLTALMLIACVVSGGLLARVNLPIFFATLATAATTLIFDLIYGISEIEPYLVPLYIMLLVWLGTAPYTLSLLLRDTPSTAQESIRPVVPARAGLAAVLLLAAFVSTLIQYPNQDYSSDHLAGQFVENVMSELPPNSVLITDYWDFYAPTIYLQNVMGVRPDVSIVDMSLLKYPWYTGYLQINSPSLIENSKDLLPTFQFQQRRWVNGEIPDSDVQSRYILQTSYFALLNSFIDRNKDTRPEYVLFLPCGPTQTCDSSQVGLEYNRHPVGLTSKLVPKSSTVAESLPAEPIYKLQGITEGNRVPMDDFARTNSCHYVQAYLVLAQQYQAASKPEEGQKLATQASNVQNAIPGQCR